MELVGASRQRVWGWPAVLNFWLGGMGAGMYLVAALLPAEVNRAAAISLLAPALVCLGLLSLVMEAGRPSRGVYLLRRLSSSWMSWETLAAGVFVPCAVLGHWTTHPLPAVLAILAAFMFLASQSFILSRGKAVAAWCRPIVPVSFFVSGLASGGGALLILHATGMERPGRIAAFLAGGLMIAMALVQKARQVKYGQLRPLVLSPGSPKPLTPSTMDRRKLP